MRLGSSSRARTTLGVVTMTFPPALCLPASVSRRGDRCHHHQEEEEEEEALPGPWAASSEHHRRKTPPGHGLSPTQSARWPSCRRLHPGHSRAVPPRRQSQLTLPGRRAPLRSGPRGLGSRSSSGDAHGIALLGSVALYNTEASDCPSRVTWIGPMCSVPPALCGVRNGYGSTLDPRSSKPLFYKEKLQPIPASSPTFVPEDSKLSSDNCERAHQQRSVQ